MAVVDRGTPTVATIRRGFCPGGAGCFSATWLAVAKQSPRCVYCLLKIIQVAVFFTPIAHFLTSTGYGFFQSKRLTIIDLCEGLWLIEIPLHR